MEPPDRLQLATLERLDDVAHAFTHIIDAKFPFTYQHSERVTSVVKKLVVYMGFPEDEVRDQRRAPSQHRQAWHLQTHPRQARPPHRRGVREDQITHRLDYGILNRVSPSRYLADLAASHHERLDGSGYHRSLSAKDLDTSARILATADVFDALSSDRPYRLPTIATT